MSSACEHGIGPSKQTHFRWGNDTSSRACKNWIYKAKDQFNPIPKSSYFFQCTKNVNINL